MISSGLSPAYDFAAFDLLASATVFLDENGCIAKVNLAAQDLFQKSAKQLISAKAESFFSEEHEFKIAFNAVLNNEYDSIRLNLNLTFHFSQSVHLTLIRLSDQAWPILLEIREVSQYILENEKNRRNQELQINKDTLRNLAHEIKNPLGGLRGAAQLLEMELDPQSELIEYTQVIMAEADRLRVLVDRLIEKPSKSLEKRSFNIHQICERVYALLRAEYQEQLLIIRDYDASLPEINGDFELLLQAYLNIARNAAQAVVDNKLVEKAQIILRSRILYQQVLHNKTHRMVLTISVIDNGPGVPEHIRHKIFLPLVTGRAQGTGLGLSLAQDLVQEHGGQIDFESTTGHTEFVIRLPLEFV